MLPVLRHCSIGGQWNIRRSQRASSSASQMFQMQPLMSPGAEANAAGRLGPSIAVAFERRDVDGVTVLRDVAQTPPLRVIRAFPAEDRSALVHMHNVSGGVLGGDKLLFAGRVGGGGA